MKKIISFVLCLVLVLTMFPIKVYADSETVVTIGADLTDAQKDTMFKYFGVDKNKVTVIEVTNAEERVYLEGVATEAQIGRRTLSCAYIQETEANSGINVKIANLNMVTSSMIATTLTTAGIYNCNVVAACPIEVSGTGALTGIMKAFESITGEKLDEEKKELATEELITTTDLAGELGSDDKATGIITTAKEEVIKAGTKDEDDIRDIIKKVAKAYDVELSDAQIEALLKVLKKVAAQDYDYDKLKATLQGISKSAAKKLDLNIDFKDITKEEAKGLVGAIKNFFQAIADFFKSIGDWFKGLGGGSSTKTESKTPEENENSQDVGILNDTDESILGDNVITNSTEDETSTTSNEKKSDSTKTDTTSENATKTDTESENVTEEVQVSQQPIEDTSTSSDNSVTATQEVAN